MSWRLTCPLVLASSSSSLSGSPDRVSPLSRPSTQARYPASYPPRSAGGLINRDGFLLPFGHRHSLLGHPFARRGVRPSSRSAYRPNGRTPTGFPRSARMSSDRGGRPLYPGDGGAHPDRWRLTAGACRFAAASPCTRQHSHRPGSRLTRHQRGFKRFARPVFPSLWPPGWNGPPLGSTPGFAPRRPRADDARRGGDRPSSTDLELPLNSHFRRSPIR